MVLRSYWTLGRVSLLRSNSLSLYLRALCIGAAFPFNFVFCILPRLIITAAIGT